PTAPGQPQHKSFLVHCAESLWEEFSSIVPVTGELAYGIEKSFESARLVTTDLANQLTAFGVSADPIVRTGVLIYAFRDYVVAMERGDAKVQLNAKVNLMKAVGGLQAVFTGLHSGMFNMVGDITKGLAENPQTGQK